MKSRPADGFGAGGILLAFVAGALAGAAAALLLAPRSGREARARLGEAAGQAGDRLQRERDAVRAAAAAAGNVLGAALRQRP